jgi:pilus assembly protein Flp/PilA
MSIEFVTFLQDEAGATAIEYGLIAALVAVAGIIAFTSLGSTISESFADIAGDMCTAVGGAFNVTATGSGSCTF